ncbi:cell surface protein SprA [Aquimarina sp. 2201CG14-23]|uniref:T9SS outer membrane translocon Sov/SprA n=1 Tax=Aquimarina mycalae TaxID=3040073 RepID=UPI0024781688|nr:cell surface protein SprA [Aquimarina sp. 2201CG14-23]MDH7445369.1 cell surface protein SprA [Aquimarina sp. 2201CG14-23]
MLFGQENETVRDSTSTTFSLGEISLPDPNSIVSKYEYDPVTNRYIYREMLGQFNVRYPLFLTPEEFETLVEEEQRRNYFKEKISAFSGKTDGSEEKRKNLLPIFYVRSEFFESIFGGDAIEIIPQGSVEMDLGILYTKQDNPAFSPRNRSNFTFDFDQRISLSLLGKVGKRLQITANYDTESTFDFQNQIKLEYTPTEDDIIRSIEIGNVTMPINNSLIQGSQSLFGAKLGLQFGKTSVTAVYSEQRSETRSVNVEGGGTVEDFEIYASKYDENRHYFLAHYFRDNYDEALLNYPFINNNIQITRIEVWITNRATSAQTLTDARNIVAIQDLGESPIAGNFTIPASLFNSPAGSFPDNGNNDLDPFDIGPTGPVTDAVRQISTVQQGFVGPIAGFNEGFDYAVLENARQLNVNEYTLNTQLGYISLNQRLNNDEVLAVAFQYTVGGQVYQVGEFANDGVDATIGDNSGSGVEIGSSQSLVVKMLKSPITSVDLPMWDLMMKNIYNTGAFRLDSNDFRLNIVYSNPSPVNYIVAAEGSATPLPDDVNETRLLSVFNMDRLNPNNDPVQGADGSGDGFFDYVPGLTIDPENGRIIFTTVEPFGQHLFNKLDNDGIANPADYNNPLNYNENQTEYVFRELYTQTKIVAEQEAANKNYFQLKGRYKSSGQDGIPLGAFNVPQGSVTVTAGGRTLQEGVDYTVNYSLGRVNILDEALLASNTPIQVSTENNAVFGQQTKRFTGLNIEHKFSDNFIVGGTYLNLNERPITQKSSYNFEPINNTLLGFNLNYSTEVPFLTRMVNKLPNIDTDVPSNVSVRTEGAYLIAGAPKGADFGGRVTTYIDDFEGAQTQIDVSSALSWELSSVPIGFDDRDPNAVLTGIESGYRRADLSWYTVDPIFYSSSRPSGISDEDINFNPARRVFIDEIFPVTDRPPGQTLSLFPLDLSYRPSERGPYNFNPAYVPGSGLAEPDPATNFAGITRQLTSTNFEQSNVEFIEFWLMDPFFDPGDGQEPLTEATSGTIVFHLGNISEDVLKDGRKQYENGLPTEIDLGFTPTSGTIGQVPVNQSLIYAFDSEGQARVNQDAGYDGLNDAQEATVFSPDFGTEDPANDNYTYFLQGEGGIVQRYNDYNGTQGNSPTSVSDEDRGNTTFPTAEDVNRDNTMNTIDSYFEYEVPIFPGMSVGNDGGTGFISDSPEPITTTILNGVNRSTRWIRFKVPIYEPTNARNISDFRSIRFMRMVVTGFDQPVVLRFATLDLVRGDYRRYIQIGNTTNDPTSGLNIFGDNEVIVTSVSEEETFNYVTPPGVRREELINNNTTIREDERSLALTVNELQAGDSRGVYKNFNVDMRQYENLEMFLHAENLPAQNSLLDDELVAFVRMGNDFTNNFYQIELPLKVSDLSDRDPEDVWPTANRLNLPLEFLQEIKSTVIGDGALNSTELNFFNGPNDLRVGIKGNPNFGDVRVMMVGVKNPSGSTESGTVWFNEMRLSDLKNQGGWAAVGSLDANIADFATISASGRISTIGFGGIEQGPNERSNEDLKQYDLTTNVNLGQLLPKKWGVQVPFNYSRGEELITPQYDPEFLDLELQDRLDNETDPEEKERIRRQSVNYTKRQSFNVIGLRKDRTGDAKPMPYDVENFTFSGTYNQTDHHDFEIENSLDQSVRVGGTYDFSFQPKEVEPFKKIKFLGKSKYFDLIKDFNFNLLPTSISVNSNISRQYNEQVFRDITRNVGDIPTPTLKQRNFLFDWQYGINYNLTKSLNFSFASANNRIVKNFIDEEGIVDDSIGVWSGLFDVGDPNFHSQQLQVNYEIPFNKIPLFKFMRATYSYSADFQWTKSSEALRNVEGIVDLGNTVQNANIHTVNGSLDMGTLYKYVGLTKKKPGRKKTKKKKTSKEGEEKDTAKPVAANKRTKKRSSKLTVGDKAYNTLIGLVTAIKKVNVNYQQDNGIFLPGYLREPGFVGTLKPTVGFTFGSQSEIRDIAARNGWLTLFQDFNQQYREVEGRQLNIQASVDLLKDLKIDISASRNYSETFTENYRVDSDLEYQSLTPNTFGNYTISTLLIKTAFKKSDEFTSETFEEFRENRFVIARRLALERGIDPNLDSDGDGFPDGLGGTNQAVLLPAFLAAYTGADPESVQKGAFRDVPMPNWDIKYTGLMNLKWFKKRFKRFSMAHGYRANYTINQFQTNLDFNANNPDELDQGGNFKNPELYANINLTEQFSPLIRLDMEMKNSIKILAEWKKDRALSLSFDNNLLTEIRGNEYIIGLGYRVQDLTFVTRIAGKKTTLKSDLNFRADLSLRQNETVIRYLDIENTQVTAGQDIYGIKFTTDYALSKNLTALLFYDHTFSKYSISTAFPQTTIRGGFTLRYNFGN